MFDKANPKAHYPFVITDFFNDQDPHSQQLYDGFSITKFNVDGDRLDAGHYLARVASENSVLVRLPYLPNEIQHASTSNEYHDRCAELNMEGSIVHREAHRVAESTMFDSICNSATDDFGGSQSVYFLITFLDLRGPLSAAYYGEEAPEEEGELCLNAVGKIPAGKQDYVYHANWKVHIQEEQPRFGRRVAKPTKSKKSYTAEAQKGMTRNPSNMSY